MIFHTLPKIAERAAAKFPYGMPVRATFGSEVVEAVVSRPARLDEKRKVIVVEIKLPSGEIREAKSSWLEPLPKDGV